MLWKNTTQGTTQGCDNYFLTDHGFEQTTNLSTTTTPTTNHPPPTTPPPTPAHCTHATHPTHPSSPIAGCIKQNMTIVPVVSTATVGMIPHFYPCRQFDGRYDNVAVSEWGRAKRAVDSRKEMGWPAKLLNGPPLSLLTLKAN